jgi:predicted SAM-dependent methyltransferase
LQGSNKNRNSIAAISRRSSILRPILKSAYFWINYAKDRRKWKKLKGEIRLDLGSGPNSGDSDWTTVDWMHADITHDLKYGIPLPDGSVTETYSSHLLEHLDYASLTQHLSEVLRVLKVSGRYNICIPNSKLYIEAYMNDEYFNELSHIWRDGFSDTGSFIDQVNYICHMAGHHKMLFDEENIVSIIKSCGFSDVKIRKFGHPRDMQKRQIESIYVEAIK